MTNTCPNILDAQAAADYCRATLRTLKTWRAKWGTPLCCRAGKGVTYHRDELDLAIRVAHGVATDADLRLLASRKKGGKP